MFIMLKLRSYKVNMIQEIAQTVRQHYLHRFLEEYNEQKHKMSGDKNRGNADTKYNWNLITDCELSGYGKNVKYKDMVQGKLNKKPKLYRHDMVLMRDTKPVKPFMCWPVLLSDDEEYSEEDIPFFPQYSKTINTTIVEINPFPWFVCNILFYPNAENVKGIMDLWFQNWFYPKKKPNPFLNVVHRIDGPHSENEGGELYQFDFGTAPAESFCDLINNICGSGVDRIVIK